MSFSIGAIANGLAGASDKIQAQNRYNDEIKRREEQEQYNRQRQATADQQSTELYKQQVQRNDQVIANGLAEQGEYQRKKQIQDSLSKIAWYKQQGDLAGAGQYLTGQMKDYNAKYHANNPDWNNDYGFQFNIDPENPAQGSLAVVDKDGRMLKQLNGTMDFDGMSAMLYSQLDPIGDIQNTRAAQAKRAETLDSRNWDLQKMGVQAGYDVQKENRKFNNDVSMEKLKFGNQSAMEQYKQGQANYRTEVTAAGKVDTKTAKAVASGVNGAIQFAEQNVPMLSFLNNDPNAYLKTMAMMGIESGGQNVPSYNGTSTGYMQLHKKYAQGFANQFGVKGNPLTDPQANIQTGAALIKHLDKKYNGDPSLIAAAYNAGEPAIDKALKAWNKAEQQGGWFDYLNISDAAKNEAYNHILKYNHALSLLDGSQQQAVNQGQEQYVKGAAKAANSSIQSVATKMAGELGLEKETAPVLGALAGTQGEIAKFANAKTTAARSKAFDNIAMIVESAVKSTEAGAVMSPQARRQYILQYASELVGAANKTEAGLWINDPKKRQVVKQAQQFSSQPTKLGNGIAGAIDNIDMSGQTAKNPEKSVILSTMRQPNNNVSSLVQNGISMPPNTSPKQVKEFLTQQAAQSGAVKNPFYNK